LILLKLDLFDSIISSNVFYEHSATYQLTYKSLALTLLFSGISKVIKIFQPCWQTT